MPLLLKTAITWMTLALIFYTYAVFSGRRQGLRLKHLSVFGIGLFCDWLGTSQMSHFATQFGKAPDWHNWSGLLSLGGMAFHFLLALLATLLNRAEAINLTFHRVSLTIYTLWITAFASGWIVGIMKMHKR
ncbi:HsmA family protein [Geoanaerobacter pelophilus]|uniref:HsmA family protein n=1 Tax=Geoanaerobacter pelophilus TaxID=60036 RepID=UPI003EB6F203